MDKWRQCWRRPNYFKLVGKIYDDGSGCETVTHLIKTLLLKLDWKDSEGERTNSNHVIEPCCFKGITAGQENAPHKNFIEEKYIPVMTRPISWVDKTCHHTPEDGRNCRIL